MDIVKKYVIIHYEVIIMPNWKVHLEIAKRINKKLKYTDANLEKFNLGNVLPDINNSFLSTFLKKFIFMKFIF